MSANPNAQQDYLKQLNTVQRQAVTTTDGPVLVVAGPGSGKTRVLTYRIAHLIHSGVKPWEILTLTFTNKAAREMKERIEKVVGPSANQVWAGTFHSIFSKILRIEAKKIGYPSNFTIYDSDDSKSVITAIIKEMNLDKQTYNANAIKSRISSAKSNLIPPRMYEASEELRQQDRIARRPHLHKIYTQYSARCKRSGAMDFDDLLYRLFELLHKNPDGVLEKYQQRFKYVLVDEFQDTNHLQYRIVQKLVDYPNSPRNICVVGDDAQSIYAFRGATIQNILDFEKDYKKHGIKTFKLEQNYRSTNHIVQAANEVITYNKRQIQKTIRSEKGSGEHIKLIKAHNDTEEGKRVADTILEQKNRNHLSNKDIAILYRTNSQSRVFEEYLRRYNIAYKVFGGQSFYQRKEVKDLIAYLRLAVNPNDDEALRRVINYPRRGIGATSLGKVAALANTNEETLWTALPKIAFSKRTKESVEKFRKMVDGFQKKAASGNAYQAADFIARKSGLIDVLKTDTTVEGANRLDNFTALLDAVKEFVESDLEETTSDVADKSLASYLQNIALLTDADTENEEQDYVTLMSVHAAKGLEFSSVFVVGLEENLFPSFMSKDSIEGTDEERRLFYVAITRAEAYLTLSYAGSRVRHGRIQSNPPSRFLDEIDYKHFDTPPTTRRKSGSSFDSLSGRPKAGVTGNFKRTARVAKPVVDPSTFKPSPAEHIQVGNKVLHLQFGEGHITNIDGHKEKRVATIVFPDLEDSEKRIMLRFAKLQILS